MVPEPSPAITDGNASLNTFDPQDARRVSAIVWSKALPAAATGGLLSALSMYIPYGSLGVGMVLSGYFCVVLYYRRTSARSITRGLGAKLGAASGALGFVIFAGWTAIQVSIFHAGGELREQLIHAIEQSAAGNPDPNIQNAVAQLK